LEYALAAVSSFTTIIVIVVILAGVMKLFQIATDIGEMKALLKDIKRNGQDMLPAGRSISPAVAPSRALSDPDGDRTASMLRALSAEEYAAALQPEVVPPAEAHRQA
jgi:hypothetical protein